jgi:hypothetical protein
MARVAKTTETTKTTKPAVRGRKPGRPASVAAKTPGKVTKPAVAPKSTAIVAPKPTGRKAGRPAAAAVPAKFTKVATAPKRAPAAAAPTQKLSKDELRVQLEKLEHANAMLRAKSRKVNRTAKAATARIAELEEIVARLEQKAAPATPAKVEKAAAKPSRVKHQSGRGGPGVAVPPGVATQEPAPQDDEAETAQESLEEQLGHN